MRKFTIFLMLVVFSIWQANAQTVGDCGNLKWNFEDGVLTISGEGEIPDCSSVVVQPWGSLAVKSVVVEEGVTYIGKYAFASLEQLESVTIAATVERIANYAFRDLSSLREVRFAGKEALPTMNASNVFRGTSRGDITAYCDYKMYEQYDASSFGFGTYILTGEYSYSRKSSTYVTTYEYNTSTAVLMVNGEAPLADNYMQRIIAEATDSYLNVYSASESELYNAETLILNEGITEVGDSAFIYCEYLMHIEFPATLEEVNDAAFLNADELNSVVFASAIAPELSNNSPFGSQSIGIAVPAGSEASYNNENYGKYFDLSSLSTECGAQGDNLTYSYSNGTLTIAGTGDMKNFEYGKAPWNAYAADIVTVNLPEGLTGIGDYAFCNCNNLSSINIAETEVGVIGRYAFYHCSALEEIELPATLRQINENAFRSSYIVTNEGKMILNSLPENVPDGAYTVLNIVDGGDANASLPESAYGLEFNEANYKRTFAAGGMGTIVIPFNYNVTPVNGLYFYELSAIEGSYIVFNQTYNPEPNKPYLWQNNTEHTFTELTSYGNVSIAAPSTDAQAGEWSLVGSYQEKVITGDELESSYALTADGKLMNSTTSLRVKPYRAYFSGPAYGNLSASHIQSAGRTIGVRLVDVDGETTTIENVIIENDGSLNFDNAVYDLSGRRVENPSNGIFIVNGKKNYIK